LRNWYIQSYDDWQLFKVQKVHPFLLWSLIKWNFASLQFLSIFFAAWCGRSSK
jgi:hypothetical protein